MNKIHDIKLCLLFILISGFIYAQSTDLLRLESIFIPENGNGVETTRYRFLINVPIKLKNENFIVTGVEFNRFDFETDNRFSFDTADLDRFYVLDLNLGYIAKWNEKWRLITLLTPRLASNFTEGGIVSGDYRINAAAAFLKEVKDVDKPYRLVLGLSFNSNAGLPFPLPIINYYKRFHPKWSYTLGIPRMDFRYHISKKHTLQSVFLLDGYFAHIQDDINFSNGNLGDAISFSALLVGIEYQFNINKYASFYGLVGHSLLHNSVLRDDRRNEVFTFNNEGNTYIRAGFKIGIF